MLTEPSIADMIAMICMVRTYLLVDDQPNEERLADLERIARMLHSILSHCGAPPHLQTLSTLWECCSRTLRVFESELFPGEPLQTPGHIAMPAHPRALSTLTEVAWIPHRPEVRLGYLSLLSLRRHLAQHYDVDLHLKTFQVIDDTKLLLETVGHLIGTPLEG